MTGEPCPRQSRPSRLSQASAIAAEVLMNNPGWRICWTAHHFPIPIQHVRVDHITPHTLLSSAPLTPQEFPF